MCQCIIITYTSIPKMTHMSLSLSVTSMKKVGLSHFEQTTTAVVFLGGAVSRMMQCLRIRGLYLMGAVAA